MSEEIHRPEPAAGEAGWPMPSPDTRRLLQPVPAWVSSWNEDGDAHAADPASSRSA